MDINILLSKLLEESGANLIISNPEDLSRLQQNGLELDNPVPLTQEEYIDKLFEAKKCAALESIKAIPSFPDVRIPMIGLLYKEIIECVLFGLSGAAITLSAVLVEIALKLAIVKARYGNEYKCDEWDRIERIELGPVIKEAKQLGILNDSTEKQFLDFKNQIRNPYLHYNIKALTKGVRAEKVKKLNLKTQEIEEVQLQSEADPILWPYAKKFVDNKRLNKVLGFACYAVKLLHEKSKKQDTS